ncbi:MAG: HAD family hydrolase [Polyangiaceae bacterium]|nr:HAD family hydrolase [Polyangiaceae bacterium]
MPRLRGVLFDLDGTLVDVAGATVRCVQSIARDAGARPIEPTKIRAAQASTRDARARLAQWVVEAIRTNGGAPPPATVVGRALSTLDRHIEPDLRVVRTLAHVGNTCRIGIVTNGGRKLQRAKLHAAGLAALVPPKRVFVSGELGVRKPNASIFHQALQATGEPADSILFVGDDEREDVEGARAVGMRTCRVAPRGTATSADSRVEHVAELMEMIACET